MSVLAAPIEGALPIPIWRILTPGMILYNLHMIGGLRGIPLPSVVILLPTIGFELEIDQLIFGLLGI